MIDEFGSNLHVVFIPKVGEDWETYASWYSVNKNLPYATCSICYFRQKDVTPFQLFQWAKRLELPICGTKDREDEYINVLIALSQVGKLNTKKTLIVTALDMVLKPLTESFLNRINTSNEELVWDKNSIGFSTLSLEQIVKEYDKYMLTKTLPSLKTETLSVEAKEQTQLKSLVSYKKGCGKWIHTKKGCPFASAGGLISEEMTVNEQKIIDLWRKMVPLYSSIS